MSYDAHTHPERGRGRVLPIDKQLYPLAGQNMESNTLTPTGQTYSHLAQNTVPVPEFINAYATITALISAFAATFITRGTKHRRSHLAETKTMAQAR